MDEIKQISEEEFREKFYAIWVSYNDAFKFAKENGWIKESAEEALERFYRNIINDYKGCNMLEVDLFKELYDLHKKVVNENQNEICKKAEKIEKVLD